MLQTLPLTNLWCPERGQMLYSFLPFFLQELSQGALLVSAHRRVNLLHTQGLLAAEGCTFQMTFPCWTAGRSLKQVGQQQTQQKRKFLGLWCETCAFRLRWRRWCTRTLRQGGGQYRRTLRPRTHPRWRRVSEDGNGRWKGIWWPGPLRRPWWQRGRVSDQLCRSRTRGKQRRIYLKESRAVIVMLLENNSSVNYYRCTKFMSRVNVFPPYLLFLCDLDGKNISCWSDSGANYLKKQFWSTKFNINCEYRNRWPF